MFRKAAWLCAAVLCAMSVTATAQEKGKIPWDLQALSKAPATRPAEGFQGKDVQAIYFDGLPWKGKPTRVFAWVGMPSDPNARINGKVPAMVLVHGGGGTAFDEWVRLWNSRGYAAIAMDTCGCTPGGKSGKRPRQDMGGPGGWGGFDQVDEATEDQWTYHAIADAILAHSLLRSMEGVDANRIGVTGISWGGYLTNILAGVDDRFLFAVPVYGCGFLGDNSTWLGEFKKLGPEKAGKWLKLWDPSAYLSRAKMPMLWVTGTNDFAYPMDSLQKSYRLPAAVRTLCIRPRMPHGHGGAGENPEEIRVFADSFCKGGTPMATVKAQGATGSQAWVTYESKAPIVKAELNYTKDTGVWQKRAWLAVDATLDQAAGKAAAEIPAGTTVYYFNLTDDRKLVVSSEHVETKTK